MSTLSVRLPESVHRKLKELAQREGVSMNQLISLAVTEKISALLTVDYLRDRARNADPKVRKELLGTVPDREADERDRLS